MIHKKYTKIIAITQALIEEQKNKKKYSKRKFTGNLSLMAISRCFRSDFKNQGLIESQLAICGLVWSVLLQIRISNWIYFTIES